MSNWIYNWLRSKVGEGQVLVRDGHRLVGMSRTEYLGGDNLRPVDDATYDLGDSSHGWRNLFLSGDLAAGGGFRQCVQFGRADVAAGSNATASASTPVQVGYGANGAVLAGWVAPRAGSITALSVGLSGAAAGSDCIVGVYKNGTLVNAAAVVTLASATSDTSARTTFAKDLYAFAAGDVIDVRIRTGTAWSATTVDLAVAVEIEC